MTREEAIAAMREIWNAGLYGREFAYRFTPEQFAAGCNGIGPESWPEERRAKLDKWLATFRRAADVHDLRFTYDNDGTRQSFDAANDELEKNCRLLADGKYAWYNPWRYVARRGAHLVAKACRDFGWSAYSQAYEKQNPKGKLKCAEY